VGEGPEQPCTATGLPVVRRLALLGGESSGKTTLARALAEVLRTIWVPEYGRELWEQLRQTLDVAQLLHVAQRQVELEEQAVRRLQLQPEAAGSHWLVCDTTPLTTLQYCLHDHGHAPAALHALARRSYELQVLCLPDFGFVQDGCRRDDPFRRHQHQWTVQQLTALGVQPLQVNGGVQQRVQQVLQALTARATRLPAVDGAHAPRPGS
jgi:HTH-type transcriptional regulator, transcriptional repressor of NAD biosynthesis genes